MNRQLAKRVSEKMGPTEEQRQRMFRGVMERRRTADEGQEKRAPRRSRRAVLAVTAAALCLATTAFAAVHLGLDARFLDFLRPSDPAQEELLANGACTVDKRVETKDGALEIKQVVGDGNLTYILMDFIAPEGTVLGSARYRFEYDFDAGLDFYSTEFISLPDEDPADNRISLVMGIMTKESLMGHTIDLKLSDLQGADAFPGAFETAVSGEWTASFALDFKDFSTEYPVNREISLFDCPAELKAISISPISIALRLESPAMEQISRAAGGLQELGPNQYLDSYPLTIHYADGTSETTTLFQGMSLTEWGSGQMLAIKTFDGVVNDRAIRSLSFFGAEIPVAPSAD